jgi:twitching motility protein PilT
VSATLGRRDFEIWLMTAHHFVELFKRTYQGVSLRKPETSSIFEIFDEAVKREASDIHLSVSVPPTLRVDGSLVYLERAPLTEEWMRQQVVTLFGQESLEEVLTKYNRDGGFSYGPVRFRINVGADMNGLTMAIRRLPSRIPSFDDLGLPMAVRQFCELERGLILVTGPTGSGKSTTLAVSWHTSLFTSLDTSLL